jgi:phospholipase/lecithinase/hemolysin
MQWLEQLDLGPSHRHEPRNQASSFLADREKAACLLALLSWDLRQTSLVKSLVLFVAFIVCAAFAVFPAQAAFSSIYIFGDGVSTTTDNPFAGDTYYGLRRTNGRVWAEVLAERQGIPGNTISNVNWSYSTNNWSYFGHYSSLLVQNLISFPAPTNAQSCLFVIWVNNADFVYDMSHDTFGDLAAWTAAINQSLTNHWTALTNLYFAKGARTLVLPNAVDITEIPAYVNLSSANKTFVRERVSEFNSSFAALLVQAQASLPGVKIYCPDMFSLLDDILAHPANYGVTNVLFEGQSIDAMHDLTLTDASLNGPGASYIFWDDMDPSAKVHAAMADVAQQLISPAQIANLALLGASNRLDVVSLPLGLAGSVDRRPNLVLGSWTSVTNLSSTSAAQSIFVPATGAPQFYRLRFPFAWSWP